MPAASLAAAQYLMMHFAMCRPSSTTARGSQLYVTSVGDALPVRSARVSVPPRAAPRQETAGGWSAHRPNHGERHVLPGKAHARARFPGGEGLSSGER